MQIGVFGGTFDPPHVAHITLVKTVIERGLFDQVWYLPVAIHQSQFAKQGMSSMADRLALLGLVQTEQTRIERYEIESEQPSHTHSTLRRLRRRHPEHTFSFIMGSDQLPKLHLWNCEQDTTCFPLAADEFNYYVYPRAGFDGQLPYPNLKIIANVEPMALSSTEVRQKVAQGRSITGLVTPEVEAYIAAHQLYEKPAT
jgi:nicotinate-nucleotide adenylyltransferase